MAQHRLQGRGPEQGQRPARAQFRPMALASDPARRGPPAPRRQVPMSKRSRGVSSWIPWAINEIGICPSKDEEPRRKTSPSGFSQGWVYGHVNNVFEREVGGHVAVMPLVRSVSAMSVYVTADSTSFWPPPQVGGADEGHGGGETSRLAVIDPFLPLVNAPVALTGPPTVTLLAAF